MQPRFKNRLYIMKLWEALKLIIPEKSLMSKQWCYQLWWGNTAMPFYVQYYSPGVRAHVGANDPSWFWNESHVQGAASCILLGDSSHHSFPLLVH